MEKNEILKIFPLRILLLLVIALSILLGGLLYYSYSKGIMFDIWGEKFGATKVKPNKSADNMEKINILSKKVELVEKKVSQLSIELSSLRKTSEGSGFNIHSIAKTRVVGEGQVWSEPKLSFSFQIVAITVVDGESDFEAEIKTSESPRYRTKIYKGWKRDFDVNGQPVTVRVINTDAKHGTATVDLRAS